MLAGSLRPPRIDLDNERILQRHCFAETLAEYWRWLDGQSLRGRPEDVFKRSGDVAAFFDDVLEEAKQSPQAEYLRLWLTTGGANRQLCCTRLQETFHLGDAAANQYLDLLPDLSNESANPMARAAVEVRRCCEPTATMLTNIASTVRALRMRRPKPVG